MKNTDTTWFILRREPLYHKLQYSKVPKYDSSAAILGTVIGAFGGYLALATVGSGGTDLTDLTTLAAWVLVTLGAVVCSMDLRNAHTFIVFAPAAVWVRPISALFFSLSRPTPKAKGRQQR
jgi:predicted anti-sigma-YlaC factor YlaD